MRDEYPQFIRTFMKKMYADEDYPQWAVDALAAVGVDLRRKEGEAEAKGVAKAEAVQ